MAPLRSAWAGGSSSAANAVHRSPPSRFPISMVRLISSCQEPIHTRSVEPITRAVFLRTSWNFTTPDAPEETPRAVSHEVHPPGLRKETATRRGASDER